MNETMTVKQALELIGGLSAPSKMPCHGFSIPARHCQTGMKLRNVEGTVCSKCYALKGRYGFGVVQNALERRFANLNHPQWVEAMIIAIRAKEKSGFFRFHDAGDIQSVEHLARIVEVCKGCPDIQFWLPTREYGYVSQFVASGAIPANLTIRLSTLKLEAEPPTQLANRLGCVTSGVSKQSFTCPAPQQGNVCGDCRACWKKEVANVNYKTH